MAERKITVAKAMVCVFIVGTLVVGSWTSCLVDKTWAETPQATAMIVKGCQMVSDNVKLFSEQKQDVAATRKAIAEACNVLSQGREAVLKDRALMMASERLGVGLEMMVSGCKMIGYGLKQIEQKTDEGAGKKLIAEGINMVTDGKKLFDEGVAKATPK